MNNQKKAYFFALLAVLFWSTVSTAFKIALKELDNLQLLLIATLVSVLISFSYLLITKKIVLLRSTSKKDLLHSAIVGLISPFGYYTVLFKAYSLLPAQIAQALNYSWPVVLVLLSAPLLKQKLTLRIIFAFAVSFAGIFIIATQGKLFQFKITSTLGVILAVSSSVFWSLFWILNLKDKRDEIVKLFLNFSFALIYEFFAVYFFSDFNFQITTSLFAAIYVGFFELGITFIVWLTALKYSESTDKVSNLIFLSPVLALFFIHLILKEQIFYTTYIGLAFILTGIFILNKKNQSKSH